MENADLFDDDSIMDLGSDLTPSRRIPPRFKPKLKGKTKAEPLTDPEPDQSKTAALSNPTPMEVDDDEGDEEDKVVCEIDVYCNHLDEDSQLYIMQYPLRPYWRPYELDERCEMVKVKPKHSEVELVMSVDVESENYDASKPGTPRLQKQILSSSSASSTVQYAAGILIKNQLHLSPIHEVLQFRPSMKHIDECESQQVMRKTEEVADKANKGKLVLGDSADHLENPEPWVSLEYNPIGSELSCKYQQKLMTQKDYNISFTMSPSGYLNSLCPGTTAKANPRVPSSSFCPSLPLEERLKEWLCKGCQVNHFAALTYLDSTIPKEDFLKMIEKFAFLVQGLWVSKSSLIYEGYEAQLRDYILFLFSQNHVIKQSKLKELKISDEDLRLLLRPLAYERLSLGDWKLREERDSSFIKEHLEIVKEQEIAWLNRGKHLKENLSKPGRFLHVKAKNSPISNVGQKKASAHVDTGSNRSTDVPGRKLAASMSNENRKSLKNALFHIFRDRTARSINTIIRELRGLAVTKAFPPKEDFKTKALVSAIASFASGPSPDFLSVLKEVAVEVHNVYVLRSGQNPALDPLRDAILGLFRIKGANAKLTRQEIVKATKATLKRDIPDSEYKQVVNELCVYVKGTWALRGADNTE